MSIPKLRSCTEVARKEETGSPMALWRTNVTDPWLPVSNPASDTKIDCWAKDSAWEAKFRPLEGLRVLAWDVAFCRLSDRSKTSLGLFTVKEYSAMDTKLSQVRFRVTDRNIPSVAFV